MSAGIVIALAIVLTGMLVAFALGALGTLAMVRLHCDERRWHAAHDAHLDAVDYERSNDGSVRVAPSVCEMCGVNPPDVVIQTICKSHEEMNGKDPKCIAICRECQREYRESVPE